MFVVNIIFGFRGGGDLSGFIIILGYYFQNIEGVSLDVLGIINIGIVNFYIMGY